MKVDVKAKEIQQVINAENVKIEQKTGMVSSGKLDNEPSNALNKLQKTLVTCFSLEELKTLSFRMGVNYDNLSGENLDGKARELVLYLERHQQVSKLIQAIRAEREDIDF